MKKTPETVAKRLNVVISKFYPEMTNEQVEQTTERLWDLIELISLGRCKEDMEIADILSAGWVSVVDEENYQAFRKMILKPRTLSPEVRRQRLINKLMEKAMANGIAIEIKGE